MRKFILAGVLYLILTGISAQPLSGIKTIPGDYSTIALAVSDLNVRGTSGGGVTFEVAAGHSETGCNIVLNTNTSTYQNSVIFRKSGTGANPLITASPGISTTTDGIVKFCGTDYVTFDGIDILDPPANTTPTTMMEWGYAILTASDTNASQHITIVNCNITLQNIYNVAPYSSGIYSRNHTDSPANLIIPSSGEGVVSHCRIDNCLITNVVYGINWTGPTLSSYYGQDNFFGSGGGNTIMNTGSAGAPPYCVFTANQNNLRIENNQVAGSETVNTAVNGIYCSSGINSSIFIRNNKVTMTTTAATGTNYGIYNSCGSSGTGNSVKIKGNQVTVTAPYATTTITYGIFHSASAWDCQIDSNIVNGCIQGGSNTASASGTFAGIFTFGSNSNAGSHWSISGNTIRDNVRMQSIPGLGNSYGIYNTSSGQMLNVSGNTVTANSWPSAGFMTGIYISNSIASSIAVNNNTISDLIKPGAVMNVMPRSGSLYGLYISSGNSSGTVDVSGNTVENLINSWGGQVLGIRCDGGSGGVLSSRNNLLHHFIADDNALYGIYNGSGYRVEISGNSIYALNGLTGDSAAFYGICTGFGTVNSVTSVFNNNLSDLSAPENVTFLSAGLYCFGTTIGSAYQYFNNTVYLDQDAGSGISRTAALYTGTLVNIDVRNNILVNNASVSAGGKGVAYWRSGINSATHSPASDFNCLYAGSPGINHLLYYAEDAVNPVSAQSITEFHSLFPGESQSFTELPPFLNTTIKPYNLEINSAVATQCESGGSIIQDPDIHSDNGQQPRFPHPGYPDNPEPSHHAFAPDCGADEFGGIPLINCLNPEPGNTVVSDNDLCLGQSVTLSFENTVTGNGITYQWQHSADSLLFEDIPGANNTVFTVIPEQSYYYRCKVICHSGMATGVSTPVKVRLSRSITEVFPGRRCESGTVNLSATAENGIIHWYTNPSGGTSAGTGNLFTTPVLDTTTTYYVAAESAVQGVILGNGGSVSTSYESPFYHFYGGKKSQYLMHASELISSGLTAGEIFSISFEVVSPGTNYNDFNISLGHTSLNVLPGTMQSGLTNVYSVSSVTPLPGIFTFTFTTPFTWDGVSNLILETCWSNQNTGGSSCTVKYDAMSYAAQCYYRADNLSQPVLCGTATATATMSSRPKMYFNYVPACTGPRVPVTATVYPKPELRITDGRMTCAGEAMKLEILSGILNYDTYTWSPATHLFTDSSCTVPYLPPTNSSTVFYRSDTAFISEYTCSASNSATTCATSASTVVSTLPDPVIHSTVDTLCFSGIATLTLSPATGYQTATIQWQESYNGIAFSDIPGATAASYTTPSIISDKYYKALILRTANIICAQPERKITVLHPEVTSVTGAERCGPGPVILHATASYGAILIWYDEESGGSPVGYGQALAIPLILQSKNYYVSARQVSGNETTVCESLRTVVTAVVTPPAAINVSANSPEICYGSSVFLTASSQNPGYQYTWNPGNITGNTVMVTPEITTRYHVAAWDMAAGCGISDSITVTVNELPTPLVITPPEPLVIIGNVQRLVATGGMLSLPTPGQAQITWSPVTNLFLDEQGTIPYSGTSTDTIYTIPWDTIVYTATAVAPVTGCQTTKNVTITALNPCISPSEITVLNITRNSALLQWTPPVYIPYNGYEYEIRLTGAAGSGAGGLVTSGTVLPVHTSVQINGLTPNTLYHSYIRSLCDNGRYSAFSADFPFTTLPYPPVISGTANNVNCHGACNGAISTSVGQGMPPFSYLWSNGMTTSGITGICAGDYSLTVTDAILQTDTKSWTITQPGMITGTLNQTNVTCYGAANGSLQSVNVGGGTPPYTYFWNNGATTSSISGLAPGNYFLTISDANTCKAIYNATIVTPSAIIVSGTVTNASCPGAADGNIQVSVSGGAAGYGYLWNNGATSQNLNNLLPGLYSVTVTDQTGCHVNNAFTVGMNSGVCANISITGTITTTTCYNATSTITVAGGGQTFIVQSPGKVNLIAGSKIFLKTGTRVYSGGYLRGKIAPAGPWCTTSKLMEAEETEVVTQPEEPENLPGKTLDENLAWVIYPNPCNGNFFINIADFQVNQGVFAEIYTINGIKVRTEKIRQHNQVVQFSEFPAGIYFVRLISGRLVETRRLVKVTGK